MAYEKKTVQEYIAETEDKTVEGFNNNQEDRIASEFSATEITRGSNERGSWTKFPDGTMICRHIGVSLKSDEPSGGVWAGSEASWTYPQPFVSDPFLYAMPETLARWVAIIGGKTSATFRHYQGSRSETLFPTRLQAIGRWK